MCPINSVAHEGFRKFVNTLGKCNYLALPALYSKCWVGGEEISRLSSSFIWLLAIQLRCDFCNRQTLSEELICCYDEKKKLCAIRTLRSNNFSNQLINLNKHTANTTQSGLVVESWISAIFQYPSKLLVSFRKGKVKKTFVASLFLFACLHPFYPAKCVCVWGDGGMTHLNTHVEMKGCGRMKGLNENVRGRQTERKTSVHAWMNSHSADDRKILCPSFSRSEWVACVSQYPLHMSNIFEGSCFCCGFVLVAAAVAQINPSLLLTSLNVDAILKSVKHS